MSEAVSSNVLTFSNENRRRTLVNMTITTNKACSKQGGILGARSLFHTDEDNNYDTARTDARGDNNIAYGLGALHFRTTDEGMRKYIAKYLAVQVSRASCVLNNFV